MCKIPNPKCYVPASRPVGSTVDHYYINPAFLKARELPSFFTLDEIFSHQFVRHRLLDNFSKNNLNPHFARSVLKISKSQNKVPRTHCLLIAPEK